MDPASAPHLHALIIGVGHYPYAPRINLRGLPRLDDLTSPPRSANALADWLVDHKDWLVPPRSLGSVDLITATPSPGGASGSATLDVIARAYDAWFERCNAHPDNVALFYFCGHGLQKDVMLLLPQDFGALRNSPWAHAIDFNATYRGMATCRAKTQYFVLDACRQWNTELIRDLNASGVALGSSNIASHRNRSAPTLYGAIEGGVAFGDVERVSPLTAALIDCLEGKAAELKNGRWLVYTGRLGIAVKELVELNNRHRLGDLRQIVNPTIGECAIDPIPLIRLPKNVTPDVLAEFGCDPDHVTCNAHFFYKSTLPEATLCRAEYPGAWSTRMTAGLYAYGMDLPGKDRTHFDPEPFYPPYRPVSVPVS